MATSVSRIASIWALADAQGFGRGVDGVMAEHEIMRVRHGRADHEFGVGASLELDGIVTGLEDDDLAVLEAASDDASTTPLRIPDPRGPYAPAAAS